MAIQGTFQPILDALTANNAAEAHQLIRIAMSKNENSATLYYLQGKAYMKQSNWGQAISCFKHAEEIDPHSPARECRLMLDDIMDFYNKDMYNQ